MPRPAVVLRLIVGSNTHWLTPWLSDIGPSIIFETAVFVIYDGIVYRDPLALSLQSRTKGRGMKAGHATARSGVAPYCWVQYAWDDALVHRYSALRCLSAVFFHGFGPIYSLPLL